MHRDRIENILYQNYSYISSQRTCDCRFNLKSHHQNMPSINTKYHKIIKLYMLMILTIEVILTSELTRL